MRFTPEFIATVRRNLRETLADTQHATHLLRTQLRQQLAKLDVQEENLLDLAADGTTAKTKIRQRLHDIEGRRANLTSELEKVDTDLSVGAELLDAALQLMENPGTLYRRVSDQDRRLFNQAIFEKLYIGNDTITGDELREPFTELVTVHRTHQPRSRRRHPSRATASRSESNACYRTTTGTKADLLAAALAGDGLSKAATVELRGIEPLTSCMPCKRSAN
jgi:site-specific DNA recombinase